MRGVLALGLVIVLAGIVGGALLLVALGSVSVADMKGLLESVLPPVVALTGTAVGFYFGGRREL